MLNPRRPAPSAAAVSDTLIFLPAVLAAAWWTAWLLIPARAGSLDAFPFGLPGYCFLVAAALSGLAALWFWKGRSPVFRPLSVELSRADAIAFAVAALVITLFWERSLLRGWAPVNALFLYVFHPTASLTAECLQKGVLPLWNPWANAGSPLMADPLVAAFSPLNLPLFLAHVPSGFRAWLFGENFLFFSFTYLWMRDRGLSCPAAFGGGALAVLNAYTVWHTGYLPHAASLIWMPAILHAVERRSFPAVALAASQQLLAGHYQYAYMTWLCAGVLLLWRRAPRAAWGTALGGALTAVSLSAFQILPTVELIRRSTRGGALDYDVAVRFSDSAAQMAKMLFVPLWIRFRPALEGDPHIVAFSIGIVALLLAVAGAILRRRPEGRTALLWTGLGLFLALGAHNSAYRALHQLLPGLSLFRFPAQWMGIALIGFVVLTAEGVEALLPKFRMWAVALVVAELFLFNVRSPFLWVDRSFLSDKPAALSDLAAAGAIADGGHRVLESAAVEAWRYGDLPADPVRPDFASWQAVKDALAPCQGEPFHVREAKSVTNHTLRSAAALQRAALRPDGRDALRRLGVSRILDVDDPSAVSPIFRWKAVDGAWAFCRTPAGETVPAAVDESNPNVKRIALKSPWPADGVLEVGEMFYPGWSCRAAGAPRPTGPSGDAFREMSLKTGDQGAVLRYDAPVFFAGVFISWITLLGLVFAVRKDPAGALPFFNAGLAAAGAALVVKGVYDLIAGQPYANFFSPAPWDFVPARAFVLFALSELAAGAALAWVGRKVRP